MNHDPLEQKLEKLSKSVALTATEKAAHRGALLAAMKQTPVVSPFSFLSILQSSRSFAVALLVLVVAGGGTTLAAESSKPGDALYPVKLRVVEPARLALSLSPEDRAELHVAFADERLTEYAKSSLMGEVSEEVTDLIFESLDGHIAGAIDSAEDLRASGDEEGALVASADLRSSLLTHATVLEEVDDNDRTDNARLTAIRLEVSEQLVTVNEDVAQLSEEVANTEQDAELAASLEEQEREVRNDLLEVRTLYEETAGKLDEEDKSEVTEQLNVVEVHLAEAETLKGEGSLGKSFVSLTEAQEELASLRTLIEAQQDLGIDVVGED